MKRSALKTCLTLAACFIHCLALGQTTGTSVAKDDAGPIHAQIKAHLVESMREAAKNENIAVDDARMFYGSLNDGMVVAVPTLGVEKLTAKDFVKGQNIGLVYFSSATPTNQKKEIPPGTFVARIIGDPSAPNARAQLVQKGKVIVEVPMRTPCKEPSGTMSLTSPFPLNDSMWNAAGNQGRLVYAAFHSSGPNDMSTPYAQEGGFTRCYGFIMYCKVGYGGGYYSERWYFCGFCFGVWW